MALSWLVLALGILQCASAAAQPANGASETASTALASSSTSIALLHSSLDAMMTTSTSPQSSYSSSSSSVNYSTLPMISSASSTSTASTAAMLPETVAPLLYSTAVWINQTSSGAELVIDESVVPALGLAGGFLLLVSVATALFGATSKWTTAGSAGFYFAFSLVATIFVALRGLDIDTGLSFGVAAGALSAGAIVGAGLTRFKRTECLIGAPGGFAVGVFVMSLGDQGLIPSAPGRWSLLAGLALFGIFSSIKHRYASFLHVVWSAIAGGLGILIGIDCFARIGLREMLLCQFGLGRLYPGLDGQFPIPSRLYLLESAGCALVAMAIGFQLKIAPRWMSRWSMLPARSTISSDGVTGSGSWECVGEEAEDLHKSEDGDIPTSHIVEMDQTSQSEPVKPPILAPETVVLPPGISLQRPFARHSADAAIGRKATEELHSLVADIKGELARMGVKEDSMEARDGSAESPDQPRAMSDFSMVSRRRPVVSSMVPTPELSETPDWLRQPPPTRTLRVHRRSMPATMMSYLTRHRAPSGTSFISMSSSSNETSRRESDYPSSLQLSPTRISSDMLSWSRMPVVLTSSASSFSQTPQSILSVSSDRPAVQRSVSFAPVLIQGPSTTSRKSLAPEEMAAKNARRKSLDCAEILDLPDWSSLAAEPSQAESSLLEVSRMSNVFGIERETILAGTTSSTRRAGSKQKRRE